MAPFSTEKVELKSILVPTVTLAVRKGPRLPVSQFCTTAQQCRYYHSPQSLERHTRERRLLDNQTLNVRPFVIDLLASHIREELLVVLDDQRDFVYTIQVQL